MDLKTMGFLPWSEFFLGIIVHKACMGIPQIMVVHFIFFNWCWYSLLPSGYCNDVLLCLVDVAMYSRFGFFLRTFLHSHLARAQTFSES